MRQQRNRRARTLHLAALFGALLWLGTGEQARAGYNPYCDMAVTAHHPADGETDVVRNTIILNADEWCTPETCNDASITVLDASHSPVPFYAAPLAAHGCVPVFHSSEPLAADAEYCVVETNVCFVTGTAIDDQPPEFALGKDRTGGGLNVSWTGSDDIVVITMNVGEWGVGMSPESPLVHFTESSGHGDTLTITAWDRAGNSTTDTVKLRGCASGGAGCSPVLLIMLLGWLASRVRRESERRWQGRCGTSAGRTYGRQRDGT